ncbi:class A beta-lactamase [Jeotgalibacillus sp. ET6]|uniref:class A beta-lactamase n=1 Tax=Jeotgalibacillus sp. ET6 TaxID=3037260 RepID=UPI003FA54E65
MLALSLLFFLAPLSGCVNADSKTSAKKETDKDQAIQLKEKFEQLENESGAQIGVYALDTETNQTVEYRSDERFAYASTFKVLAAAILLKQHDEKALEKNVTYTKEDLVTYSPVTEKHVDKGMTLLEISEAAIRKSDNTAANLMLEAIGGPEKFEAELRKLGDDTTVSERFETELNEYAPGQDRDTSTPKAMAENLKKVAIEEYLPEDKREWLNDWMSGNATGDALIRAGAPEGWIVDDKSGAASYGTRNDIAVVRPPDRKPILIATMSKKDKEDAEYDDALIAEAAKITLDTFK